MGMLPLLIAGIAALAIVVIAVGIAMSAGGGGVSQRLERYASPAREGEDDEAGAPESAVVSGLSRVIEKQDFATRLGTDLARADLKMKPAEFLILWAITPIGFLFVAFVIGIVFEGFRNPVALVVFFLLGLYAPRFYLNRRKAGRLKAFAAQLPDTITLLANSLRAGSSFLQGMELVTREARPPISEEFERVVREMQLGRRAPPGPEQPRSARGVRGPGADGHRHPDPEPGRRQPRHGPRRRSPTPSASASASSVRSTRSPPCSATAAT